MSTSQPTPMQGFSKLHEVVLDDHHQALFEAAQRSCAGPVVCRLRLSAEARDLAALAQISGRLKIASMDLSVGLRACVELEAPVPCMPQPGGALQVAPRALLGLRYSQEAISRPQPGFGFVSILAPLPLFHANVSPDQNQVLCLGPKLPAGICVKQIVLMAYGALTMQTISLSVHSPAGLLNPAAADWWQRNTHRIPLSREPFLRKEALHAA